MRNIKLMISSFIAIVGIIIYFVSIPKVNEDALVKLTVEAGDEKLLDDIYFEGYIYDYSLFQLDNENGVMTNENLPYLEKLDAPGNQSIKILQEKYPDFVNELYYGNNINGYYIINNDNDLVSGHFENYEGDYSIDASAVYLSILNKENNEIVKDKVKRENYPEADQVEIVGMYEEYPVVKILYSTSTWAIDYSDEKGNLSVGEYNFETKNYTETSLLSENGMFYDYNSNVYNAKNNEIQIITHDRNDYYNEYEETNEANDPTAYIYNFVENSLTPLKDPTVDYFIGNSNQLFALKVEGDETFLRQYNQTGEEVENEVLLNLETPINLYEEYPPLIAEIIDDQLFIVQSTMPEAPTQKILPSILQVFDVHSGENLLTGKINYDTASEVNATEGYVHSIGQMSDF